MSGSRGDLGDMKRAAGIYERVSDLPNLCLAFWKAARGKQSRPEVIKFRNCFDDNISELQGRIIDKDLELGDYRFFKVHDPKERSICAASFPERVLHHAVMNLCEPIFDRYAVFDSYACRKGKGSRKAVLRCQEFSRTFTWYLKMDIRKYFDSIDHEIVLKQIEKRFKDRDLLSLFRRILSTYETAHGKGLPIGNLISQHLANFHLGQFDHWIKEHQGIKGYVRYMDDFILWHNDRKTLKEKMLSVVRWLGDNLRLEVKNGTQLNRCSLGIGFLGYRVYPGRIVLSHRSKHRFIRKLEGFEKRYGSGSWSEDKLRMHVEPLVAFTKGAEAAGFRSKVIAACGASF